MYKALYRKYRPLEFSDVVGQEHVTTTLRRQVEKGNVSHAYLFTGSRGTGKTTCAKILARAINCLNQNGGNPCGECENCAAILKDSLPDVMEIDAASNNGVDYIRELRERIAFAPVKAKYKVYIIDEVHMLSTAASNALLKTLEEPPAHAVFILATTEINAILPTILSRCQRFDFHRIEPKVIADRVKYVCEKENLKITDDAASLIAALADGGMRDALSLLDLCANSEQEITEQVVNSICGRASTEYLFELATKIKDMDAAGALETIETLHRDSVDMQRLCSELCGFYRNITLICSGIDPEKATASVGETAKRYQEFSKIIGIEGALRYLSAFNDALTLMTSGNRRSILEMAIIKLATPGLDYSLDAVMARIAAIEGKLASGVTVSAPVAPTTKAQPPAPKKETIAPTPTPTKAQEVPKPQETPRVEINEEKVPYNTKKGVIPCTNWNDVISECFKTAPLLRGLLNGTSASFQDDKLIIHSQSRQLRAIIEKRDNLNYKGLCQALINVFGKAYTPVMEKEKQVDDTDPMFSFMNKLNNL